MRNDRAGPKVDLVKLNEVLRLALSLPDADRRSAVRQSCGDDPALITAVERALTAAEDDIVTGEGLGELQPDGDDLLGTLIDGFLLVERVGSGGFGDVYLAQQLTPIKRRVAFKILKAGMDTRAVLARFELERQALARMDHPNVAAIYGGGATGRGRPYFVMEYVDGQSLLSHCDAMRLSIQQRLELFLPVCAAVQHAHQKGVIHRDLKPSNILVAVNDEGHTEPKVIDFGIAKATAEDDLSASRRTRLGELVGTLAYMSPEQAASDGSDIDTRTDVYGLGVVLYRLLTGFLPVDPRELSQLSRDALRSRLESTAVKPSLRVGGGRPAQDAALRRRADPAVLKRQLRGDLDRIVLKAMHPDRTQRYDTAAELASDIRRHLNDEPVTARSPSAWYRLGKFARRNALSLTVAGAVALALVGALIFSNLQRSAAERARANLQAVTEFQSAMLQDLVPETMGRELADDIRSRIIAAAEIRGDSAESAAGALADFDRAIANVNLTDAARWSIHRSVLTPVARTLAGSGVEDPLLAARLQFAIAQVYVGLALHEQAEPMLRSSWQTRRDLLGSSHPDTQEALTKLAHIHSARGELDEAESIYRNAVEVLEAELGPRHEQTINAHHNLASVLQDQGRLEEADVQAREAYERAQRYLGDDHELTVAGINLLGRVHRAQGNLDEAERYYRLAVERRTQTRGETHPLTLVSLNNLSHVLHVKRNLPEAGRLLEKVLAGKRSALGDEHPSTLISMNNLAYLQLDLDQFESAEALFRECYELSQRALGAEHPDTLAAANGLGDLALRKAETEPALNRFGDSVERHRRALGEGHPQTLWTRQRLGWAQMTQGSIEAAESTFSDVWRISERHLGATHPDTLEAGNHWSTALQRLGRLDEAEKIAIVVLERTRERFGPEHSITLGRMADLGDVLVDLGRNAEAEALLEGAHRFTVANLRAGHPEWIDIHRQYGRFLLLRGDLTNARPLLEASIESARRSGSASREDVSQAEALLAEIESAGT